MTTHSASPAPISPVVAFEGRPMHLPLGAEPRLRNATRAVRAASWGEVSLPVPPHWRRKAESRGFRIVARVRDERHVSLECLTCGALTAQQVFTLLVTRPACGACIEAKHAATAAAAGLTLLRRDPTERHYAVCKASCGHEIRRQLTFVERVAAGETGIRCETCQREREDQEARSFGWRLVGPDPRRHRSYRLYRRHCGHEQRIARADLRWGQASCGGCGRGWGGRRSAIYLTEITFPDISVLELGFSANPEKRFRHQLGLDASAKAKVLRTVWLQTGHAAIAAERRAHADLRRRFPEAVIPRERLEGRIRVVSELYDPAILPEIQRVLDGIAAEAGTD